MTFLSSPVIFEWSLIEMRDPVLLISCLEQLLLTRHFARG